jgi:small subunit ribosomal protein S20
LSIAAAPGRVFVFAAVDAPKGARYRARLHPLNFSRDAARFLSAKALSKDHIMANTKSAKKAVRQTVRRTTANKTRRSRMRSSVRKVEEAIASGNKGAARAALKEAEPIIVRTAQKGMVHRKTASRKVSRLAKRVGAMGTP